MTIWGIDISSHQPTEDWPTLKANKIAFAAVKRTGGGKVGYTNEFGRAQIAGARSVGIVAEHYLYLGESGYPWSPGAEQAQRFIAEVGDDLRDGELPIVDWEEEGDSDIENLLSCLQALETRYGVIPAIYSYPDFLSRHVPKGDTRLARYPLFFASYRSTYPPCPAPWSKITIWQYSDNENIPGIGHVDGDRFEGTVEELKAYGKKPTAQGLADEIAKGINVVTETHPDGMMSPVTATFLNPDESGMGVPYKLAIWAYNPQEDAHYMGVWEMGKYQPWVKLPEED